VKQYVAGYRRRLPPKELEHAFLYIADYLLWFCIRGWPWLGPSHLGPFRDERTYLAQYIDKPK
jgi:hypothetical protein